MRNGQGCLVVGLAGLLVAGLVSADPADERYTLTLFHTNDLHGRTDAYPQLVSTLAKARERHGDGLLLDAGDIFSGTLYFTEFHGQDAVEFMNLMGYDAFVPGNHEFDLGDPEEGHLALAAFFEAAEFPIVAANMDFSASPEFEALLGESLAEAPEGGTIHDGIVVEHQGERIGIFGLNTQDTPNISSPGDVSFSDYREAAEAMVERFEAEGIDKIIALTHLGYDSDPSVGNDLLLAQQVEGIDIIIGGHSHTRLDPPTLVTENQRGETMAPTVIGQAGEYGEYLGVMEVIFDGDGMVVDVSGELLAVENSDPDPQAAEMLAPYTAAIESLRDETVGVALAETLANPRHGDGDEQSVRANETALGNLIADGQLAAARRVETDTLMALQNGGGIRQPLPAGEVTVGDLIAVQPFGNRLTLVELSGAELIETFEIALADAPGENGGFLHVSDGTQLVYDSREAPGERVVTLEVEVDGSLDAIAPDQRYTIATNHFTAAGGDSHHVLGAAYDDGRGTIVGTTDWEMLRDHLLELDEVSHAPQGRIVDLAAEDSGE
ncbi:bifunctional metallophosphatase/5'-nucleotidase [Franzmannia qiaohouensis]|uniref:5'-nucleotidase C-terminal domain-containing protein n=1 Tax=Franzmannia qiaohouensis TaxID=1329370 RepID=A0ABU1H9L6_9GAMM|nr:5'-nucleotidase C-terminal domain-containing protein [Halomonas qiaohouensis]MDR5904157.1 5'-nucleotidase C-terminal domain-containing protein [Halomonas qiaohouensis]